MKVELFPFQKTALAKLRMSAATALGNYKNTHTPQVVSYTAPTGAGKTIIMASLIEAIFNGDELYPDQADAVFVWLSDSPQLNEQSRMKIDTKADKIRIGQCITINDDSFDRGVLDDGHIYFLNTQKLGKNSNLTKHSDGRQYTIWETLANTVRDKSDRLYFIIDEAHRGAQKSSELARATTIMQKFLKGSDVDKLPPMPVVIGMTATSERFNRLAEGLTSTTHKVITTTDEVRSSGLLKDKIIITYPETAGNDMAVLQAAADEWKDKWNHWEQYCQEQHYAYVNPILIIQVQNATAHNISATDLDECLRCIEERLGERFVEGEVVHAFGDGEATIQINGLDVHYVEPSAIADDKRIKIVFFKETLSTGWDCPRAETMMSFRRATDYTYIAQLLGRMIRTPLQMHINVDESLNDVHLYLPQFDASTVYDVVNALQSEEGASIPADIEAEEMGSSNYDTLVLTPTYTKKTGTNNKYNTDGNQITMFDPPGSEEGLKGTGDSAGEEPKKGTELPIQPIKPDAEGKGDSPQVNPTKKDDEKGESLGGETMPPGEDSVEEIKLPNVPEKDANIDRAGAVKAINDSGLLTYNVRKVRITDYLKSMYALARLLTHTRIDMDAQKNVIDDIVDMIHQRMEDLKANNMYDYLADQVMQFKLNTQIFDVFGKTVDNFTEHDLFSTTDMDIDRQYRLAETRLGNEGVANQYCIKYYDENNPIAQKIDVIIFAADEECMGNLQEYAKNKFHDLNDENRRKTVSLPDRYKKKYDDIVSDGDIVSKHNFRLPEEIRVPHEVDGYLFSNHLFVERDTGFASIKLNGWEQKVIEEEAKQDDFVCWLRNPSRGSWALCIPYELDGDKKPTYPDFLIIRKDGPEYVVDILEPHNPTIVDNLGKAKGFAEYARQNPGVGRIQLIRMKKDALGNERPYRLDMSKSSVRDKVTHCASIDELNHIFESDGFFL